LEAVLAVRTFQEVWIFDLDSEQAHSFASEVRNMVSTEIRVANNSQEVIEHADVICTATTSSQPVFDDEYVMDGAHINAVGAYTPQMQEVPRDTVVRSKVVVDHKEASFAEAGDLLIPMQEGVFAEDDIFAELGEIAAGVKLGRESSEEITLFKSVGVAVQDVAAANLVLKTAEDLDLGLKFEL
jgi:ornithine cyclodeaminase/alanine dehydrogenase-like protein (mu-crystallin family)